MKPAPFEYFAPETVDEAVALLAEHGDEAKILAGGQSLMPLLNMRLARPAALVDATKVAGLDAIRETRRGLVIGAMTSKRTVERSALVRERQPLLHAATLLIAHPQIRNRGTVGGSLAHADPAAEYPAVAVALDAELTARGPRGERRIAAADFFVSYLTTALEPAELLTEVRFPTFGDGTGWACQEIARRHGDFAMAGVAVTLKRGRRGRCADARVVLFGVGPAPVRARAAEQLLVGEAPGETLFAEAGRSAGEAIDEPLSDVHASAEYRRHLAQVLTRRGLAEAAARAGLAP
ncbi:MAG: xanthine dehydrogenase family protein subunit M [Deltaproteobacteria bacterium]|nr:MAG: xanthine dehydrogenase family protein subunit M [Deltaproteobacteria bacterium]